MVLVGCLPSKLTIKKLKVFFFLGYMAFFSFNYFIDLKIENGHTTFKFDPQNVPTSVIIITAVLIVFLVFVDVIDHQLKMSRLANLVKSNRIPLDLKNKAIDELIKSK
jgi:TRAP-type C4-dicarboxylate transport system permease small subunit